MKTHVPVVAGPFATWNAAFETMWHEHALVQRADGFYELVLGYDVRRIGNRWFVLNRRERPHAGHRFTRRLRLALMPEWRRRRCRVPMTAREAHRRREIAFWDTQREV